MTNTIQIQFPEEQISNIIHRAIQAEFETRFPKSDPNIPRIDSAKAMGITVVTWDRRANEGLFKTIKIGGKVFIKESEHNRIMNTTRQ
jgi:hypothetical protein